ncbi:MAG: glycosyltransferase family 39 protein [Solirubrobacteraceae bacterium]
MVKAGRSLEIMALPVILVAAGINFFLELGAPSYFVDEALSIEHSLPGLTQLTAVVRTTETTPYTYFLGLHEWLYHGGSQVETAARLPSAIAGVLLVAATYWMARAFLNRRFALVAAMLTALSPLVLEYAQQVRVYVFVMLATVISVGATVRGARGNPRWLVLGAVAAVLAVLLHYTATFVIVALCAWLVLQSSVPKRARAGVVGAVLVAEAVLAPLFVAQYRAAPNGGDLADADLSGTGVVRIAQTPFDGRWVGGVDALRVVGVAVVVVAVVSVWMCGRGSIRDARLLVGLGVAAPVALILAGMLGKDILITRYTAVSAPLLVTAVAAAIAVAPRPAAAVLAATALAAATGGLIKSHGESGYYGPARQTIDYIASDVEPGDAMVVPGSPAADISLGFYAERRLSPRPTFVASTDANGSAAAFENGGRIWIVRQSEEAAPSQSELLALSRPGLATVGYRPVKARAFETSTTLLAVLAEPAGP